MKIPFTSEQFIQVIEKYNHAIYPIQYIWIIVALLAVYTLFRKSSTTNLFIGIILSSIWIWAGIAYHLSFFTTINKAAYMFGSLFILQGIFILWTVLKNKNLQIEVKSDIRSFVACFLLAFGIIIYPVIIYVTNQNVETLITLGLPCPSTIMTFGFFMLSTRNFPKYLLVIPVLWSLIGTTAALKFNVYPDVMLLISAIAGISFLAFRKKEVLKY